MQDGSTKMENERNARRLKEKGIEVNFGTQTHGFILHPHGIYVGLTPKLLSQATKRNPRTNSENSKFSLM